jgi:hypothetical protein
MEDSLGVWRGAIKFLPFKNKFVTECHIGFQNWTLSSEKRSKFRKVAYMEREKTV